MGQYILSLSYLKLIFIKFDFDFFIIENPFLVVTITVINSFFLIENRIR